MSLRYIKRSAPPRKRRAKPRRRWQEQVLVAGVQSSEVSTGENRDEVAPTRGTGGKHAGQAD